MKAIRWFNISRSSFSVYALCIFVVLQAVAAILYMVMFCLTVPQGTPWLRVLALLLMGSSMAVVTGGGIGFLFGIPRANSDSSLLSNASDESVSPPPLSGKHRVNTNLEQISDWLTKILVGVGLTQLYNLKPFLLGIAQYLSAEMKDVPSIEPMIAVSLVVWFTLSFFSVYLLTRISLSLALVQADAEIEQPSLDS